MQEDLFPTPNLKSTATAIRWASTAANLTTQNRILPASRLVPSTVASLQIKEIKDQSCVYQKCDNNRLRIQSNLTNP